MDVSAAGVQFIAGFEGYEANWYDDGFGTQTIGYGHTGKLPSGFKAPLSKQRASDLLHYDLRSYVAAVVKGVKTGLTQNQFDALVSFAYNLGTGRGGLADLFPGVNARKFSAVAKQMLEYDHAGGRQVPGLTRRRKAEAALFLKAVPKPAPIPEPVPARVTNLRAAVNAWTSHHCKDLLGPLKTDGPWGRLDHKVVLRALFYFGFGQPTIRVWDKHITDQNMLDATDWFRHPSHFYKTHPKAQSIGKNRIAAERKKRKPFDGLAEFDGVRIAPWIQPILVDARKRGWKGTIPDKVYGGFRTYAMQKYLYEQYQKGGGIAASPDLPSNHQLKDFDGGAVDCSYNDQLDSILHKVGSELGRQGSAPSSDPVHFSSRTRFRRTGHY